MALPPIKHKGMVGARKLAPESGRKLANDSTCKVNEAIKRDDVVRGLVEKDGTENVSESNKLSQQWVSARGSRDM